MCVHCKERPATRGRGLCWGCSRTPVVKAMYAPLPGGERSGVGMPECWACGAAAPRRARLLEIGWRSRTGRHGTKTLTEVYCPGCFAAWGWPDWSGLPNPVEVSELFAAMV